MNNLPVILVVDDEKDFRDLISAKLNSKGFAVKTVSGGSEAVAAAKSLKPDLILMDVQMPDRDGIKTTIDLQSDPQTKHIKIMFLTNLGDSWPSVGEVNRKFAKEIGAVDYFKKSGDYDLLVDKIRQALAR